MRLKVEFEHEEDGRWIAEIPELPGVLAYGTTHIEAEAKVKALALRVVPIASSTVKHEHRQLRRAASFRKVGSKT